MQTELKQQCHRLRLTGLLQTFDQRLAQAQENNLSFCEWLSLLLSDEIQRREANLLQQRTRGAKFEQIQTLEEMNLRDYLPESQQLIRELACGHYLNQQRHIIIKGPVGAGKTHLAQALGHQACRQGYTVQFIRANALLRHFEQCRQQKTVYEQFIKSYIRPKLLIIDDFGLRKLTLNESQDLYELVAERYLKGCFIITTNRKSELWAELFPDSVVGNAIMDRLCNQAYHLKLDGTSWRRRKAEQMNQLAPTTVESATLPVQVPLPQDQQQKLIDSKQIEANMEGVNNG